jgi:hypothetical protein
MKIKLNSIFVDNQDKALKFYTMFLASGRVRKSQSENSNG